MLKIQPTGTRVAVFWIPLWQVAVAFVVAGLAYTCFDGGVAGSVLVGGLISAVGSVVFAINVFVSPRAGSRDIVRRMFRGEALKLVLVALLFYLAIILLRVQALPTMVGFLVTLVVFWVALLRSFK